MTPSFEKDYWEQHWEHSHAASGDTTPTESNPYLLSETSDVRPGTALDAGCGTGAEAVWLAAHGWTVTGVDISATALAQASARAAKESVHVAWIEADLTSWVPSEPFDLVTTHYAHPATGQLAFYERIAEWVAPRGTLLIVGHLGDPAHRADGRPGADEPPAEATASLAGITRVLDPAVWRIESAEERTRLLATPSGHSRPLRDVVVRAARTA